MSRDRKKTTSLIPVLLVAVAVAIWLFDAYKQGDLAWLQSKKITQEQKVGSPVSSEKPSHTGRYDTYTGCTLADDRTNDGDSFRVKLPDGRTEIIRLYFADCPESAFKTYASGENNHDRIDKQANDMGGIMPRQAVEIGKKAKEFTLTHLGKAPFTLHTEWDSPFNDKRYHGFVLISYNGKTRFLHELLIEKGYARIQTKGAQLPDGTSEGRQEDHLYELQRTAKSTKAGAWAY
jgi:endonuclease YncB( thermonuclease family)